MQTSPPRSESISVSVLRGGNRQVFELGFAALFEARFLAPDVKVCFDPIRPSQINRRIT